MSAYTTDKILLDNQSGIPGQYESPAGPKVSGQVPKGIGSGVQIQSVYNTMPLGTRSLRLETLLIFPAPSAGTGFELYQGSYTITANELRYSIIEKIRFNAFPYASFGQPYPSLYHPFYEIIVDGVPILDALTFLGADNVIIQANTVKSFKEELDVWCVFQKTLTITYFVPVATGSPYTPFGVNVQVIGHDIPQNTGIKELAQASGPVMVRLPSGQKG